jgi:4-hydroxyphenylacetate 3-hydroxylase N terminal
MMTGQQYKKSLDDNRETYFEGERVRDIANHPLLGECVSRIADGYDKFYSPEPGAVSPLMKIPRSADELRDRIPLLLESDIVANVTYQSIMTLTTAATRIQDALPEYRSASATTCTGRSAKTFASSSASRTRKAIAPVRPASRTIPTHTRAWSSGAPTAS